MFEDWKRERKKLTSIFEIFFPELLGNVVQRLGKWGPEAPSSYGPSERRRRRESREELCALKERGGTHLAKCSKIIDGGRGWSWEWREKRGSHSESWGFVRCRGMDGYAFRDTIWHRIEVIHNNPWVNGLGSLFWWLDLHPQNKFKTKSRLIITCSKIFYYYHIGGGEKFSHCCP